MQKYNIEVVETVTDPMSKFGLNLPRPVRQDSSTNTVFNGDNPYQDMADAIERTGNENLKRMYGTDQTNEIVFDPDHSTSKSQMHEDHQKAVMNKIYEGSALAGDPTQNPALFISHMTGGRKLKRNSHYVLSLIHI